MNFLDDIKKLDPKYLGQKLLEYSYTENKTHKGYLSVIAGETTLGLLSGVSLGYSGLDNILSDSIDPMLGNTIKLSTMIGFGTANIYMILKRADIATYVAYNVLKNEKYNLILKDEKSYD